MFFYKKLLHMYIIYNKIIIVSKEGSFFMVKLDIENTGITEKQLLKEIEPKPAKNIELPSVIWNVLGFISFLGIILL